MSELSDQDPLEIRPELEQKLSELEILSQSLVESKAKEKDVFDQLLRQTAEFQNFRKRSEARVVESRKAGKEDVLIHVIGLADSLIQAELSSRNAKDVDSLKKGFSMVLGQFEKFLVEQGLTPIKAKGERLDPLLHEAIARVANEDLDEGVIVDEIQRGYTLNGQVVRPARVSVAVKPETAETNFKEEK